MTICKRLISMFGGEIWFESKQGEGSQFHFTARFGVAQKTEPRRPGGAALGDLKAETVMVLLETPPGPMADGHDQGTITRTVKANAPLNILLAEDNAINQLVMKRLLNKRGHQVTIVSDGRSAVSAVSQEQFDLVFMDVQMPLLDGFQATGEIRSNETGSPRRIRIVALTAHAMQGDKQRCLDAGMDDYLTKPIDPTALDRVLGIYESGQTEPTVAAKG